MQPPLIEVENLSKAFNGKTVLDGVSLTLETGRILTIIGKSGVGKSVLLKHVIGLLQPDAGSVRYRGTPIGGMRPAERDAYLGKISFMFQNNALFNELTVFDNVALPLRYRRGYNRRKIEEKVRHRLAQLELADDTGKYPAELSGGMRKRVALARALITDPEIVLFDEPTTGQDPMRKNAILGMIAANQREYRFSAILISHDLPDVLFISDTVLALYEGRIIFDGSPEAFEDFDHPFRNEYIRSLELLQQELTGLYSKREFKRRHQSDLVRRPEESPYVVAIFTFHDFQQVSAQLGHTAAQELLQALGGFINTQFDHQGGFSTRYRQDQFVTVLPNTRIEEARHMTAAFQDHLRDEGLTHLEGGMPDGPACRRPVAIRITAGLAEATPKTPLEAAVGAAVRQQHTVAQFNVRCRERDK